MNTKNNTKRERHNRKRRNRLKAQRVRNAGPTPRANPDRRMAMPTPPPPLLIEMAPTWGATHERLESAGFDGSPSVRMSLNDDVVTITEGHTGVVVGKLPPQLEEPGGAILDMSDPMSLCDPDFPVRWSCLAWLYLTGVDLYDGVVR